MMTKWNGAANFLQQLLDFLTKVEGKHYEARDVGDGKVTIGSGFNISERSVREKVYAKLSITAESDISKLATPEAKATELAYRDELDAAIKRHDITALDGIMARRAADVRLDGDGNIPNRRTDFRFHSDVEVIDTLKALLPDYNQRLWDWMPALENDANFQTSLEHIALLSLSFNTVSGATSLLGSGLRRAINAEDRAEAWFEIRYNSNRNELPGIVKRRYLEAKVFGLYDGSNVNLEEAKRVYRMFSLHREDILRYEATYGRTPEGTPGSRGDRITTANDDYQLEGAERVDTLVAALDPAEGKIIEWMNQEHGLTLNAGDYVSTAIYFDPGRDRASDSIDPNHAAILDARGDDEAALSLMRNNILIGEGGIDTLIGGKGDDVLVGGTGNDMLSGGADQDTLLGGAGDDTLYGGNQDASDDRARDILQGGLGHDTYYVGDGDVIEDSDGKGAIYWDGVQLSGGIRLTGSVAEGQVVFKQEHSNLLYESEGGELRIYNLNGSKPEIITVRPGQVSQSASPVGIELKERDAVPITGAVLHDEDKAGGIQIGGISYDDALAFSTRDIAYQAVYGHGGSDWIRHVEGPYAGMQIYGGEGDDDIAIEALAGPAPDSHEGVALYGEGGNDTLNGTLGADHLDGGEGHDVAAGGLGADLLIGGAGTDWLSGEEGNDLLAGGSDNDWLVGGAGADYLSGAGGRDRLYGDAYFSNFTVVNRETGELGAYGPLHPGTYGSLKESPEPGADILSGGAGDDSLYGGAGNDRLLGGADNDALHGEGGDDILEGGAGRDVLAGDKHPDLWAADNRVIATGNLPAGTWTHQWRIHQDGAEVAGDDLLDGGSENDILYGGGGNDTYVFGYGYDVDLIDDASGTDVIRLGAGISAEDLRLSSTGDDLLIDLLQAGQETGDRLIVSGWNAGRRVESMVFADGTLWDADTLARHAGLSGSPLPAPPPSHYALGTSAGQYLPGTQGNDVLYGLGGADHLEGGARADRLFGGEGSDRLLGGAGDDALYGEAGADELQGGEGDDSLSGGAGDDHLNGGAGADRLDGGAGADRYELSLGMGNDTIAETQADGARNRIKLPSGSLLEDFERERTGSDLLLRMNANDTLTIKDYYLDPGRWQIESASGEVQSLDEALEDEGFTRLAWRRFQEAHYGALLRDAEEYNATYGLYRPLSGQVQITSLSGSLPVILDPRGEMELPISTSDDPPPSALPIILDLPMSGGHSIRFLEDVLNRREQRVELSTGSGSEAGEVWLPQAGSFTASYELDVYLRLSGGHTLGGGSTYTASIAEQTLTAPDDTGARLRATGDIYANVLRAQIDVAVDTERLQIFQAGAGPDTLGQADPAANGRYSGRLMLDGGEGNDTLYGGRQGDFLAGGPGSDWLYGYRGDDVLAGGGDEDLLFGGEGADRYLVGFEAPGIDRIFDEGLFTSAEVIGHLLEATELSYAQAKALLREAQSVQEIEALGGGFAPADDVVRINASLPSTQLSWSRDQEGRLGVYLSPLGAPERGVLVALREAGDVLGYGIERFEFNDAVLTREQLLALLGPVPGATLEGKNYLLGSPFNDYLEGSGEADRIDAGVGNDFLAGLAGHDEIHGGHGADQLWGGTGDDLLAGEAGNDVYYFCQGDGSDIISDSGGAEDLIGFDSTHRDNLIVSRQGDDLRVRWSASDELTIRNWFVAERFKIERFVFTDEAYLSATQIEALIPVNEGPLVLSPIADQGADEDTPFSLSLPENTFADPDGGDTLSYSARLTDGTALPGWLHFDPATRGFRGTPGNSDVGAFAVQITATDSGGLSAAQAFKLRVHNVNDAPWLLRPLVDQSATEYNSLSFSLPSDAFSDIDVGDRLRYSATLDDGSPLPGWLHFDPKTLGFSGMPTAEDLGVQRLRISATDQSGAQASGMFLLRVAEDPRAIKGSAGQNHRLAGTVSNDLLVGGQAQDVLQGRRGDDRLYGNSGADRLRGGRGNDLLDGGSGDDRLSGGRGNDLLQGGAGADVLTDRAGNNLFDGGTGKDTLRGGSGNELYLGGAGNDTLTTGRGADLIAFNRGDGRDVVNASTGADNTLSLGGGIRYTDLSFSKSANDLVLGLGNAEQITLKDWYATSANNKSVLNLQMIAEAMADFDSTSSDPLWNNKVETFHFGGLAKRFDQLRAADPRLRNWSLTNALLDFHLSGSDTEALGGDLAYQYGKSGTLAGLGVTAVQSILSHAQFGTTPQALQPLATLQEGIVKLG